MHPDTTIAVLVEGQHGMVSRSQALREGLTWEHLRHRREAGVLVDVFEGVYRHAAVPLTWKGRLMAAVLAAGDDGAASHRSAGRLLGYRDVPLYRPEITVAALDHPARAGIHVHRTNLLAPCDVTLVDGIRCVSGPRTCLDLGAVLPYELVEAIVQDAVIRKLVSHEDLLAVLERVGGRGRRGTAPLRSLVRYALPDERIESELERLLLALFPPNHGFELQYELTCANGRRVRLDAARPDIRVAVEANGHRWHARAKDMCRDMERRRAIQASGWELWEYGWSDCVESPAVTRAEIDALVRRQH
jgi:hypothetical protein